MTGRIVVVVGGSSGIGLGTALRLAGDGEHLVLASRSADALDRAAAQLRDAGAGDVRTQVVDVRDAASVDRLIESVVERHGRIDLLVHTAATMAYGRIEDVPAETFTAVVDTTIHGTANLARAVIPVFRRQHHGTFVIVNSLMGAITVPNMGVYAVAKWGQRAVARTLQQEVRDEPEVHVCIVSPGSTNTPIYYQAANHVGRPARPPVPVLQPRRAAGVIASMARRPRRHVSAAVGPANPVITAGYRIAPRVYDTIVGPFFRRAGLSRGTAAATDGNVRRPNPADERMLGHWPDPDPPHR